MTHDTNTQNLDIKPFNILHETLAYQSETLTQNATT